MLYIFSGALSFEVVFEQMNGPVDIKHERKKQLEAHHSLSRIRTVKKIQDVLVSEVFASFLKKGQRATGVSSYSQVGAECM